MKMIKESTVEKGGKNPGRHSTASLPPTAALRSLARRDLDPGADGRTGAFSPPHNPYVAGCGLDETPVRWTRAGCQLQPTREPHREKSHRVGSRSCHR